MDKKFSPYAGLGLGLSVIETPEFSGVDEFGNEVVLIPSEKKGNFALSPRAGIAIGGFKAEFAYHIAGKTPDSDIINEVVSGQKFNFYTIALKYRYTFEM